MRDINTPILKAYYTALNGITYNSVIVPVYSGNLPDNISASAYIIFGLVNNNDISTKASSDTNTLVRVTIHTLNEKYVSSIVANAIAGQVFARVYPYTQFNLTIEDNFQIYSTELASDNILPFTLDANRAFIDRVLIFRHKIYHGS